jgi:hypothetical protein
MSLTNRIGCFFLLIGGALLVLFLASDVAGQQNCNLLLLGILGAVVGFVMWRRNRPAFPSSGRFTTFQKLRQRSSRKKAEPPKR